MNQIERITYMEGILDEATEAISALSDALEIYGSLQARLLELTAYYESHQWRQDFADDCGGKIPRDLKRGVLLEDAVYNLLADHMELQARLRVFAEQ